jgi:type 1 glutamine amidotransferase
VAWVKTHGQGRVFYTALGDWEETWKNPAYRTHLIEGIRWTMQSSFVCPAKPWGRKDLADRRICGN